MELLKSEIQSLVEDALSSLGVDASLVDRMLQPAKETDQGDLSLPCFPFAKILGMAPAAIAEQVKEAMKDHDAILEVNAVNGYLNIRANPKWLAGRLLKGDVRHAHGGSRREVLIEHTSANPNGPFHVGRARNAILGDTLVR